MPTLKLKNIELYYEINGTGEPLLLIPGLASDSQSWEPIIHDLRKKYCVITIDNRGAGRTTPQNEPMTIQNLADDAIALINHLGFSSVNILGHSMGGFVAQDCAIRYPKYISKLILVATSSYNSKRNIELFQDWVTYRENNIPIDLWFKNMFYWIFSKRFFESKTFLNNAIKYSVEYPYPQTTIALKNQINAINKFNCLKDLSKITAKTLVISGEEDLLFPYKDNIKQLKRIKNINFSLLKGAAHAIHSEKPLEFISIINDFLV